MRPATTKPPPVAIEILWTEAGDYTPRSYPTWADVDAAMFYIGAKVRGGGYHKTAFRITWADGETYEGRIDAKAGDTSIHAHAVALHFAYYNFCRIHETIRVTPAMEAGVTDHVWSIPELVRAALDAPAGDKPVKVPLRMPEPAQGAPVATARALPAGRGFLRLVQGGSAPQGPTPGPTPMTPAPASPAPVLREVPRPMIQLALFDDVDRPLV